LNVKPNFSNSEKSLLSKPDYAAPDGARKDFFGFDYYSYGAPNGAWKTRRPTKTAPRINRLSKPKVPVIVVKGTFPYRSFS